MSATRHPPCTNVCSLTSTQPTDCITTTIAIPDMVASHVIGRAGTGLHQIHDFSHTKVNVSPHIGPSASHAITIQGLPHEVGNAIIAVGHQIVKCHIRPPHCAQQAPADPPTPTPHVTISQPLSSHTTLMTTSRSSMSTTLAVVAGSSSASSTCF